MLMEMIHDLYLIGMWKKGIRVARLVLKDQRVVEGQNDDL